MKYLITCLLILFSINSFGESFTYDGVKFSDALIGLKEPTKFSDLGNGNFEIKLLHSLYKVKYDYYDNSEKLYCYKGVGILPSAVYGGDESTVQTIITCRTSLEKFAIGIDIPIGSSLSNDDYDEEFSINVYTRTNYAMTPKGKYIHSEETNYSAFMPWVSKDRHLSEWQKENAPNEVIIHVKEKNIFENEVKIELIAERLLQGLIQLNEDALSLIETVEQYFSGMGSQRSSLSNKQDNNKVDNSQKITFSAEKTIPSNSFNKDKIEDFFFPTNGNNVSEFVLIDENGNETDNKKSISFEKLDENSFKTSTTNSLMEKVKHSLNDDNQDVKSYSTYLIKNDELLLVHKDFFNIKTGSRELINLNPVEVILKLPKRSNITEWKSKEISGDQYNCTSEFITLEIDRVKKRAIKLTKRIISEDNSTNWPNSVTYYVEGIGEWKSCMEKTGQVAILLYRQYSTSKSTNEEMSKPSSSFNQSSRSESKAEKIEIVQGEKILLQNKDEEVSFQKVVMSWNEAHNTNDMVLFSDLFTDEVNFYHTILPRNVLVQNKKDLLKKYPGFNQQIIGDITTERLNANEVKCSFIKEVTINRKVTDYPSYLILKKSDENWKIAVEGDLVTDKNIAKKKTT